MEIERDQSSITTAEPHGQCSSGVAQQSSNQAGLTSSGSVKFVSTLFLVEKENNSGQYHPVINLRALNQFVEPQPFKMESLQVVKALVQPGDYLMKMDLKDAYYTVPIHQDHCRYLRFSYHGNLYEFRCLPFGLSSASRAFTKILKPVVVLIRSLGIHIVIYLDDILLLHQNKNDLVQIFYQVVNLLQNLGFTIKREKCSLHPTQQLVFLGGLLDTMKMTISLPPEKLESIIQEAHQIQQTSPMSLEKLSSLIGRMSHAAQTWVWRAPLYYRSLQRDQAISTHQCGKHRKRFQVTLSQASMTELIWWSSLPSSHIQWPTPALSALRLDYFNRCLPVGVGGNMEWGDNRWSLASTGGEITHQLVGTQSSLPGITSPFQLPDVHPQSYYFADGQFHCRCIREQEGGTRSQALSVQALDVWALVWGKGSWITAQHIPGSSNEVADAASLTTTWNGRYTQISSSK